MKNKRTALVTGGCGFIGANFIRLATELCPDWRIINLDKLTYAGNLSNLDGIEESSSYRFVHGDICDRALIDRVFSEEAIDTVVHFAAESHVDRSITGPSDFIQTNIVGTFILLEAAKSHWPIAKTKNRANCFLHVSTDEVYGSLPEDNNTLFTETTAFDPRSPYSASKASSDHLASAYFHTYGLPVKITNCSNNYGPYQFPEKLIPLIFNNALSGKDLPVYGDGQNIRDWLYVEDHCRGILRVIEAGEPGHRYNIGGNNEKKNIDVVHLVCDLLDTKVGLLPSGKPRRQLVTYVKDRLGHDRRYAIDASKIESQLNWQPRHRFAEGIDKTVDWYLANQSWVQNIVSGDYRNYYARMYQKR